LSIIPTNTAKGIINSIQPLICNNPKSNQQSQLKKYKINNKHKLTTLHQKEQGDIKLSMQTFGPSRAMGSQILLF
jgi:hypothetical protein